MITVYHYPATQQFSEKRVPDTLESLQALVGGFIEVVYDHPAIEELKQILSLKGDYILVVNEEGLIKNLPPNQYVAGIVGDCFFMRSKDLK